MITIETERLILRSYKESDLPDYYSLLSDRKNMYYLDDIIMETLEDAKQSLLEAIKLMENGNARRFAIILKGDSKVIGGVGYDVTAKTPLGRIGHMGWFIAPEYQNKGYMSEAVKKVIEFAFTKDDCIRITTGCHKDNEASRKVMEKVGFKKEGERIKAVYHDGVMKDRLEYAIVN